MKFARYTLIALMATLFFSACTTEKQEMAEHHFENRVFINTDQIVDQKIVKTGGDPEYMRSLSISTALKVEDPVTATFTADPSRLEKFQRSYEERAILFPMENCSITPAEVVIEAGANLSTSAEVKFSRLDELNLDSLYVLPVSLTQVSGMEVLASKETVYYVFKGGALINVVANFNENRAGAEKWNNPDVFKNLDQFTIEFLAHPNKFGRLISTVLGVEAHYLLRFGDAGLPDNQLQVAAGKNHSNADLQAEPGKWTHFAVVFDKGQITVYKNGSEKLSESDNRDKVTFLPYGDDKGEGHGRYFWIGYSYSGGRHFDGEFSEIRIWNKCLTREEINAPSHFYMVDPADPALAAYWKCDDGAGSVLKDYSVNANHLTLDKACKWPGVSLPEKR